MKCACFQETLKSYHPDERKNLRKDQNIGYDYKRLPFSRQNLSGIYECNAKYVVSSSNYKFGGCYN